MLTLKIFKRFLRTNQRQRSILDEYANVYRPEIESEIEHLAVQTTRNKSLQVNYEIEYIKFSFSLILNNFLGNNVVVNESLDIIFSDENTSHIRTTFKSIHT